MEKNPSPHPFSFGRLGLLLRRDVAYGYRSTLIAMASVTGVIILVSMGSMLFSGAGDGGQSSDPFMTLFFLGGFVYTSVIFRELHRGAAAIRFLVLPGSSLEKFVSKALITSVGYALAALVFCTAASALSEGLNWLVFRTHHDLFNPVDPAVLRSVASYLVTQAVFLTGSVYFRKMAFVKTAGVVSGLCIVAGAVGALIAYAVLRRYIIPNSSGTAWTFSSELGTVVSGLSRGTIACPTSIATLARVARVLYWAALAPVCWTIGYLKMREIEV